MKGKVPSELEARLALHLQWANVKPCCRQYRFHPQRMWRFDFAWPNEKLAVEVEGAIYVHGRHTRGSGFEADAEKYNAAVLLGWRILRYTHASIKSGAALREIEQALAGGIQAPQQMVIG